MEGYSNFAWVLLISGAMALGADPVWASWVLGVACFVGSLLVGWAWLKRLYPERLLPRLVLFLIPLNVSCAAYATGGLSTSLFALGVVGSCALVQLRPMHWSSAAALCLLLLVRPEAPLVVLILALATLLQAPSAWWRWLGWLAPILATAGLYAGFKLWTFGALLPNTAHAKSIFVPYFSSGGTYLWAFVCDYPYAPLLLLSLPVGARDRRWLAPALILASLVAYVAWVGGGFMEYKALMHAYPLGVICLAGGVGSLASLGPRGQRALSWTTALVLGFAAFQRPDPPFPILSTPALWGQVRPDGGQWSKIGRRLGELLPPETTIAVTAAGAIPFHSRLRTVDMLGLTEPAVAKQALQARGHVGHEKHADLKHLRTRGVNLVIAHPEQVSEAEAQRFARDTLFVRIGDRWLRAMILEWTPELERATQDKPSELRLGDRGSKGIHMPLPLQLPLAP